MTDEKKKANARELMLQTAAALLSEKGFEGTSFSAVIDRSGAPRGSIYHHFRNGKEQMISESIAAVNARMLAYLKSYGIPSGSKSANQFLSDFFAIWKSVLTKSESKAGCAIAAVALECAGKGALGPQAAAIFKDWQSEIANTLERTGFAQPKAQAFAVLLLTSIEGALLISRARQNPETLDELEKSLISVLVQFEG